MTFDDPATASAQFAEGPDFARSIPFRFDYTLNSHYSHLLDWLTGEIFRFHNLGIPRARTIEQIRRAIDCLVANFLEAHRISPDCFVAISMSEEGFTRSRYRDFGFGYTNFKRVEDFFKNSDPSFVIFKRGFHDARGNSANGRVSRYAPSDLLLGLIKGYNNVIGAHRNNNPFSMNQVVTEARAHTEANPLPDSRKISIPLSSTDYSASSDCIRLKDPEKKLIDYEEITLTTVMRERLNRWNVFLAANHHIDLLLPDIELANIYENNDADEAEEDVFFGYEGEQQRFVELKRIRLHRVFNNATFDEGGRFYGGWWQRIPSKFRRRITINEYPTKEFDYSNLHAALLYAQEGLPLADDAYSLPTVSDQYRKLIKSTFFKLVNAREDQRITAPKIDALPPGMNWQQLQDALIAKHQPIARHFRSGSGLKLQRIDSDIAEQVMLRMMADDLLVLPVHDSFITYHGCAERVANEMKRAFREHMNADVEIAADPTFIEELIANGADTEDLQASDYIDNIQADDRYAGYRDRYQEFWGTRTNDWYRRFG